MYIHSIYDLLSQWFPIDVKTTHGSHGSCDIEGLLEGCLSTPSHFFDFKVMFRKDGFNG